MKPASFPEENVVFAKDQTKYQPLPAYRAPDGEVITCWRLSWWECFRLLWSRRLWLRQLTFHASLQPLLPQVERPFEKQPR